MTSTAPAREIITDRLTLSPMTPDDASGLFALYSDPDTMRFMPSPPHKTERDTRKHIKQDLKNPAGANWTIRLTESGEVIGRVNYIGGATRPGLGYMIKRSHWGNGYAGEAVRAALAFGYDTRDYDRVELWIEEANIASQRVAQKLGFKLRGSLSSGYPHREETFRFLVYGLTSDEFAGQDIATTPRAFRIEPVLLVHNVADTVTFYRDKLGFTVEFLFGHPPTHAGISLSRWSGGGVTIQLSQIPTDREISPSDYLYIFVNEQIDALHDRYKAAGVAIRSAPETYPWGMREFDIEDNNGHIIRFGTNA